MSVVHPSLHRSRRLGSSIETALKALLGVFASVIAIGYGLTLVYLVVRGS